MVHSKACGCSVSVVVLALSLCVSLGSSVVGSGPMFDVDQFNRVTIIFIF